MKKVLSIILAMVMAFSALPMTVFANTETQTQGDNLTDEEISIESIEVEPIKYIEYDGYWDGHYDENGDYVSGSWFRYDARPKDITVKFKDGTELSGDFDEVRNQLEEQYGYLYYDVFTDQSYENQWGPGEHTATFSVLGVSAEYTVTIVENPIESIEIEPIERIENFSGDWQGHYDENGDYVSNSWFCYNVTPENITVKFKDGTEFSGDIYEVRRQLEEQEEQYEHDGHFDNIYYSDQSYENQWGVGEHTATVSFLGVSAEYTVTVVENQIPVESIEVEPGKHIEYSCGQWYGHYDENGDYVPDSWFGYNVTPKNIAVRFKDGTELSGDFDEVRHQLEEQYGYLNYDVFTDQSYENQWGLGEHTAVVWFMGVSDECTVSVVENPVESIEVEPIKYIEYSGGQWHDGYYADGNYVSTPYYYYNEVPKKLTVKFKDGTEFLGDLFEVYFQIEEQYGYCSYSYGAGQTGKNPWCIGEYPATVSICGVSAEYTVTVVENPIESIEVEPIECFENLSGDWQGHYDENGDYVPDSWFDYDVLPNNITVKFKDGTEFLGDLYGVRHQLEERYAHDGYFYNHYDSDQSYENPWGLGEHTAVLSLFGLSVEYTVTVVENPIESIEVAPIECIENWDGWWDDYYDENSNCMREWFEYRCSPKNLTVKFKDGTELLGDFDEVRNQLEEQYGYLYYDVVTDQSYENQWGLGEHAAVVWFMGASDECTVSVVETPIESIEIEPVVCKEYCAGWWYGDYDENGNYVPDSWFEYDVPPNNITVKFKDGTVFSGTPEELELYTGYYPFYGASQSYEEPWGVGEHTATFSFMGFETEYTVTVVESPVKSPFESFEIESFKCVENDGGSWEGHYDENGNYVPDSWFCYDVTPSKITIKFMDGTELSGTPEEIECLTGNKITYRHDQSYEDQWGVGEHTVIVYFQGLGGKGVYTVTVCTKLEITTQPTDVQALSGEEATVSLEATGDGLTYAWYYKNAGDAAFTLADGVDGSSYSAKMDIACAGRQVYCVVTDQHGSSVQSDVVVMEMATADVPSDAPAFVVNGLDGVVRAGDTFTVTVNTKNNPGIVSLKVDVGYNANMFELVSIEEQDFTGTLFGPMTANPIAVNWFNALEPNNTTDGVVAVLTFKVKEGVASGDTVITLEYDPNNVYDFDFENVEFGIAYGKVSVVEYISGDVNGDGVVNNKDLGVLQRYINGWDVDVNVSAGDVNGDGVVNNKDLGVLQRYINGWDVELK